MNAVEVRAKGTSLIELLIGMAVGLIVIAGAVTVFSNTAERHGDAMQSERMTQNLRAAMAVMQREIATAGYMGDKPGDLILANPFWSTTTGSSTDLALYNSGSCIVFAYNRDDDSPAQVDENERLGFRLSSNALQMRIGGNTHNDSCAGSWESILAPEIEVVSLAFTLATATVDVADGDATCDTGHRCMSLREVEIRLVARLADAPEIQQTLQGRAQLRNHKVVQR